MSQGYGQPQQPQGRPGGQGDPWAATRQGVPQWQDPRAPQPYQPYGPPPGYQPQHAPPPQRPASRKRRVFLWVFLAVQALFLIWVITGIASHPAGPTAAQQAAQQCANGGWYPLFKSAADCQVHYAHGLTEAGNAGTAIGVAVVVFLWVITDIILGISYGVYRVATRTRLRPRDHGSTVDPRVNHCAQHGSTVDPCTGQ